MKIGKAILFAGLAFFLVPFMWISSCTHNANIDNIPEICFDKDVLPIFQTNCTISGCHNGTGESRFQLNSYASIRDAVQPGKPYGSSIYNAIIAASGNNLMPPNKPLSKDNRTIIRLWIEQGALPTTCTDTTGQGTGGNLIKHACYSRDIQPVLTSKCAISSCHDITTHLEGYNFSSYTSTMHAVSPGSPTGSMLYRSIKGLTENPMPPSNKVQLTTAEIDSITKWITYGALNETCGEVCDTVSTITFSGTIWPIMQTSCTGCHSGASPSGGVSLSGYTNVSAVAANGNLLKALKGSGVTRMPPGSFFSTCRIRQFELWINNGHLNN